MMGNDADLGRQTTDFKYILAYSGLVGDRPSHFSSSFRILGGKTKNILVEQHVPDGCGMTMAAGRSMTSSVGQFHLP